MALLIHTFILGPLENNTYLITDQATKKAVVIDPSFGSSLVQEYIEKQGLDLEEIWITHAHFDHIGGVAELQKTPIGLHPKELPLWSEKGGAENFGFNFPKLPEPAHFLKDGESLELGKTRLEVRHAPGHSPGHVVFYCEDAATVFCGDLIFKQSVGRVDLPGGSASQLLDSIHKKILTLPDKTVLMSGHGEPTIIGEEKKYNLFLR